VLAIIVPLVAATSWIAWKEYHQHRGSLGTTLVGAARSVADAADRELAIGLAIVQTLSQSTLIDEKRFEEFHALLGKSIASRPGMTAVLFDASGQQLLNTARPYGAPLPNVFEQEAKLPALGASQLPQGGAQWVRKAFDQRRPVYSDLFHGQVTGKYLVGISVPVLRGGEMLYCLTIALPAEQFQQVVREPRRAHPGDAVLIDSRGFIIARSVEPEKFVGRQVLPETLRALRRDREGFGEAINARDETIFRAFTRSDLTDWSVGIYLSEGAAFGAIWRTMRAWTVAVLAVLLFAIVLTLWLSRMMRGREEERLARSIAETRQREAEEGSRAKDRFLAALSHELRNPLGAIALASETLQHPSAGVEGRRFAGEIIGRQVAQLRRLLDDLLDTARAVYGKLRLEPRAIDLCEIAAAVIADHQRRPGTRAAIELAGELAWINADPARVTQMVDNLVDNALKYGARRIDVRIGVEDGSAVLTVADDGQGIRPDLLPRLFEPFVQGEQTIDRHHGGLGLGLALVRRLAALHGGSISADSAGPGKGSTFIIRLPRSEPPALKDKGTSKAQKRAARRVLVIEDEPDARDSLSMLLEMDGHEVTRAADGREGLARLQAEKPDVALIDIGLPGMDGYELARKARTLGGRKIRLIALTGYGQEEDRQRALDAGFDLHLTKPVSFQDLRAVFGKPDTSR
jgi:signal transduction histidine kinase/CheY-like chemotaxis protein